MSSLSMTVVNKSHPEGSNLPTLEQLRKEFDIKDNLNDFKDFTDPKNVGPGTWNVIHRISYAANTDDKQQKFIQLMKDICDGFPCEICRGHCQEYIKNNPMEKYIGKTITIEKEKKQLGMFIWGWRFHNAVNKRLKKSIMDWDTAYNLYSPSESLVCSKSCEESQ